MTPATGIRSPRIEFRRQVVFDWIEIGFRITQGSIHDISVATPGPQRQYAAPKRERYSMRTIIRS